MHIIIFSNLIKLGSVGPVKLLIDLVLPNDKRQQHNVPTCGVIQTVETLSSDSIALSHSTGVDVPTAITFLTRPPCNEWVAVVTIRATFTLVTLVTLGAVVADATPCSNVQYATAAELVPTAPWNE